MCLMDRVACLPASERSALFAETAARMKATPAVAEKDFWVTWVLERLFDNTDLARLLMFKGGTSLSKVYRLIERFSEDIDLILDWRVLSDEEPRAERSKVKQEKFTQQSVI
jgi:predicted nucleotidyltransferase component of viral defense system